MKNNYITLTITILLLIIYSGCSKETARDKAAAEDLRNAKDELYHNLLSSNYDKRKEKILAIKYDIPLSDIELIISSLKKTDIVPVHMMKSVELKTPEEVYEYMQNIEKPEMQTNVHQLSKTTGVPPQIIASIVIDYESWKAAD